MTEALPPASPSSLDPIDVSRAELYAEDRWHEPFRKLRRHAPVQHVPQSKFGPYWSVSSYEAIAKAETLPDVFSSSWEHGGVTIAYDTSEMPMLIAMDPPRHTAQRRAFAPAFGPAEVAAMREEVRTRTGRLIDSLPIGEPFDWVGAVSTELATGMLARLFEFPWDKRNLLTHWSNIAADVELARAPGGHELRMKNLNQMAQAFARLWNVRVRNPGKDLVSIMIRSDAMRDMNEREFLGHLILMLVGGNDTTRNSMSGLAWGLSQFPVERENLEADPSLIPNAAQEIIRWQTPVSHMRRTVMQDTDVLGQPMKRGDKVALWYVSGNRDEAVFEDADALKVGRENARRHLSYGHGIHRCIGARIAELQIVTLMEELAERRLRPEPVGEPERVPACFVHGYKSMPVKLERY